MSYCRFSEGDVYMFEHVDGYIECCACSFGWGRKNIYGEELTHFKTRSAALQHLEEHKKFKHRVPSRAKEILNNEIKTMGDII